MVCERRWAMRTNDTVVNAVGWGKPERAHLEADWRRAWESRAHAAQSGDYAEAERWYQQATLLGAQLTDADLRLCKGYQVERHPN
jgi:hypothetical protein